MTRLSQRFGVWVAGLALLALGAVLRNQPGDYVVDNRFEQFWNPARRLARSFTIWDSTRGMGRVREELWPGATAPVALFRLLGAPPALAEHLWHATLLAVAGTGMVALLQRYRPRLGFEHLAAGLLYMFGPYAAAFLVPSNLFYHCAFAPWLAVAAHRGLHSERPWRPAAAFAVLVFAAGNVDAPGLVLSGVAVALVVAHAVAVDRTATARAAVGWVARAAPLVLVLSAAAATKTVIGADAFSQRLEGTETVEVISTTSSWSESIRGLGLWLSYFRDSFGPLRPEGGPWFTSWWQVLASFAPVTIGVGALVWARRWRTQVLFVILLLAGTTLMVGAHPYADPPPWGAAWRWALDEVPGLATLRTTYKAGGIAALGMAALFGTGLVDVARARRSETARRVVAGAGVLVIVAATMPFWSGGLHDADRRLDVVPAYWRDAMAWLDEQPSDGQVLLLPGATRAVYRWGWPGDDIHDALMDRAHLVDAAVSLSRPLVADLLEAIDDAAVDDGHEPGELAPILRRLGVSHVVLRNDLDWRRMGVPRPARYAELRREPGLRRVAAFGLPGQDTGATRSDERSLPPVEILAVDGTTGRSRALAPGPWTLLEGSGAAWPSMAQAGLLRDEVPIVPAALLDRRTLLDALAEGSTVVVTDTNRRRAQSLTAFRGERSRTLAADEDLGRTIPDLYRAAGSQSVAAFADAVRIDEPGIFRSLAGFQPQHRPAQAFDGDLRTGWVLGAQPDPRGRGLRVELRSPQVLDGMEVVAFDPADPDRAAEPDASFSGVPRIGRAELRFSDGSTEPVNLISGRTEVRFAARRTSSLELRVLDVTERRPVGIAEIRFPRRPLDLLEHVRAPDHLARLAAADPVVRRAVEDAAVVYLLERISGTAATPVEAQLRREVRTIGTRTYQVSGTLSWPGGDRPVVDARGCTDVGLVIDGAPVRVRVSDGGDGGERATFRGCEPLELGDGWHRAVGEGEAQLDQLELRSRWTGTVLRAGATPELTSPVTGPASSRSWQLHAPDGALVLSGEGFDARWRATVGDEDLPAAVPADGQTAWLVPAASTEALVRMEFGPERWFRVALAVSFAGVVLCGAILLWPPRRTP